MEAKITIIEISPRLPYLKTVITDSFSISFLYDDNIIKIEDLESYLSKSEPPYISLPNISQSYIYFYLLKNGKYIMGIGEIPLVNSVKWYNLIIKNLFLLISILTLLKILIRIITKRKQLLLIMIIYIKK